MHWEKCCRQFSYPGNDSLVCVGKSCIKRPLHITQPIYFTFWTQFPSPMRWGNKTRQTELRGRSPDQGLKSYWAPSAPITSNSDFNKGQGTFLCQGLLLCHWRWFLKRFVFLFNQLYIMAVDSLHWQVFEQLSEIYLFYWWVCYVSWLKFK